MSIVRITGIFGKKGLISNDNILSSSDSFCCLRYSVNSLMFFTVFPDCRKGDNNFGKYFAKLYDAVLRFQAIG